MKFKKGDTILVISGKDKGKTGKVLKAMPKESKILAEKINLRKKHVRPKREGEKGQVVEVSAALNISKVKLVCPKCGKATRVGYKVTVSDDSKNGKNKKSKKRICKKCKQEI